MTLAFLLGSALGFFGAVPVAGPVSALVLQFGIKHQYRKGRILAVGAGLAEAIYTFLAFLGFTILIRSIPHLERISSFLAGAIVLGLGIYFLFAKASKWVADPPAKHLKGGGKHAFLIGYGISIMNPTLIATWTTVISTLHGLKAFEQTRTNAAAFSLGVWLGIVLWFTLMLELLRKNRHRFETRWLKLLLSLMGILLVMTGLATLLKALAVSQTAA